MRNVHCHYTLPTPLHSQLKHKQNLNNNYRFIWKQSSSLVSYGQNQSIKSSVPLRTNAIHDIFLLKATIPPAESGDYSVLIQTGALMFSVYFFTNFIVPDLMSKYFKFDEVNEDSDSED